MVVVLTKAGSKPQCMLCKWSERPQNNLKTLHRLHFHFKEEAKSTVNINCLPGNNI